MEAASDAAGPGGSGSGSALEWALVDIWPMAYAQEPPRSIGIRVKADGMATQIALHWQRTQPSNGKARSKSSSESEPKRHGHCSGEILGRRERFCTAYDDGIGGIGHTVNSGHDARTELGDYSCDMRPGITVDDTRSRWLLPSRLSVMITG